MINFKTLGPGTGSTAPATTEVHDYSGGKATKTAQWMATYFGGTVITEDPASKPSPAAAVSPQPGASPAPDAAPDIVVVLGKDFAANFDQAETATVNPPSNYIPPRQVPRKVQPRQTPTQAPQPPSPVIVPSPTPTKCVIDPVTKKCKP